MLPCVFFAGVLLVVEAATVQSSIPPVSFRIAGAVVDSVTGQPVDRAEVTLAPVKSLTDVQTFLTSTDGLFLFTNLAAGKYRLMAGRSGYAFQGFNQHEGFMTDIAVGSGLDSEHLRFRLVPAAAITGSVLDEWNDPVRGPEVLLFQQSLFAGSRAAHIVSRAATDDLGHYRFAHLLAGTYVVAVSAHPWYTQPPYTQWVSQDASAIVLEQVTDRGEALSSVVPQIQAEPSAQPSGQPATASPARNVLDVVYPITFFSNATSLADATRLTLLPGVSQTADIALRPVPSLHLRFRTAAGPLAGSQAAVQGGEGQPDPGTSVEVARHIGEDYFDSLSPTRTEISPGLFELSGIPPGDTTLNVTVPGDSATVWTQSLQLTGNTELDLSSRGTFADISGVVLRSGSLANQPSSPEQQPESFLGFRSRSTGETYLAPVSKEGAFSLAGVPLVPGTYELSFRGQPSLQVRSIEATGAAVSGRTVDIAAGQPVKLTVHTAEANSKVTGVALKDGKPFAGAMIVLVPQDPDQDAALFHRDQSDSDGSFTLANIFPGRYTILAIENGWDLEWSKPSVLFQYLPNGQPIEVKSNYTVILNPKVQ